MLDGLNSLCLPAAAAATEVDVEGVAREGEGVMTDGESFPRPAVTELDGPSGVYRWATAGIAWRGGEGRGGGERGRHQ